MPWEPNWSGFLRVSAFRAQLLRKKRSGHELTKKEKLALFDANTKWLDQLQADQLEEAKRKGTRVTRATRGRTREELYEDRGLPRRH